MSPPREEFQTFEAKLDRFKVVSRLPSLPDGIPADLGDWACVSLSEMALIKARSSSLPVAIAKDLRDYRVIEAAGKFAAPSPYRAAALLYDQAALLARQWPRLRVFDLGAETPLAHLHAANGWYELPESEKTYFRLLTKQG